VPGTEVKGVLAPNSPRKRENKFHGGVLFLMEAFITKLVTKSYSKVLIILGI
jgi:hypothetical protein